MLGPPIMCFYRLFIIQHHLIYFEEMEHKCPHNIQTQMSRCATEPGSSENPGSFTDNPNTHFSPRLGITVKESAEERVNHFALKLYNYSFMHVVSIQLGETQMNPHIVLLEICIYHIQMCLYILVML